MILALKEQELDETHIKVQAALLALGDTKEAVRDSLIKLGIRGQACSPWSCPIANYLNKVVDPEAKLPTRIGVAWKFHFTNIYQDRRENPVAVQDFIKAVDDFEDNPEFSKDVRLDP